MRTLYTWYKPDIYPLYLYFSIPHFGDSEKERIGYVNEDDGGFWMNFSDWINEFETFCICNLPQIDPNDDGIIDEE